MMLLFQVWLKLYSAFFPTQALSKLKTEHKQTNQKYHQKGWDDDVFCKDHTIGLYDTQGQIPCIMKIEYSFWQGN